MVEIFHVTNKGILSIEYNHRFERFKMAKEELKIQFNYLIKAEIFDPTPPKFCQSQIKIIMKLNS